MSVLFLNYLISVCNNSTIFM